MSVSLTPPIRRLMARVVVLLVAVTATGCSHALSRPIPEVKGPLAIRVSQERLGFGQMPVTAYQIPDTSVYVSGHEGAASVGALFGPIGVALAIATARSTGARKTEDHQAQLRLDVPKLTDEVLMEELRRRGEAGRFGAAGRPGGDGLEIIPSLVVNFVGNDHVRPWVVLRTALKDPGGKEKWKTNYAAGVGEIRPLGGESGWASDDGAPWRRAVDRNLRLAIDVLLRDASGTLPRGSGRMVNVKAQWVWVKEPSEETAEVLHETEEVLVVIPQVTDNHFFAGISILDRKSVVVTTKVK